MTNPPNITIKLYAQTDVGLVRAANEDGFLLLDLSTGESWMAEQPPNRYFLDFTPGDEGVLLAVADGDGGNIVGAYASRKALETLRDRMLHFQSDSRHHQVPYTKERRRYRYDPAITR